MLFDLSKLFIQSLLGRQNKSCSLAQSGCQALRALHYAGLFALCRLACDPSDGRSLQHAKSSELVAVQIAKVGTIKSAPARTWRPLISATQCQGTRMQRLYLLWV